MTEYPLEAVQRVAAEVFVADEDALRFGYESSPTFTVHSKTHLRKRLPA
jgi:hypothetical protein